jgi:predicted GIY-YIG superfamily endonuclease
MNKLIKKDVYGTYPTITSNKQLNVNTATILKMCTTIIGNNVLEIVDKELFTGYRDDLRGIYFFFTKEGKLLYVGKSMNLRTRLKNHLRGNSNPTKYILKSVGYIKLLFVNLSERLILQLEDKLIKELKPMFNGAQGLLSTMEYYNYDNLREKLNSLTNKNEIYEYIKNWKLSYIDNIHNQYVIAS